MSTPAERTERAQQWEDFNRRSNEATQANSAKNKNPAPSTNEENR